ncbi:MAG: hypothetical protein IJ874_09270 [Ruminococcus sp.]|nr:hypothetical protein [Ruminococcus sp.]
METYNFKDPQVWKEQERAAYDGTVKYEQFPAAEYKYFAELQKLYEEFRFGGLDKALAQQRKAKLLAEYRESIAERDRYLDVYRNYQENIRTCCTRLSEINKAQSAEEMALIACECLGLLTGDVTFLKLQRKKLKGEF